jgi:MerR family mercuric resistance operon transcriptional regulator
MPNPDYTIGQLAQSAGVNVETVRYYQRVGLIREPVRPQGGFRRYPQEAVERIRFIKRAQRLGFSLQDIAELLELGEAHCADVREKAQAKRAQIDAQIRDLAAMREALDRLIARCRAGQRDARCPIIESLTDPAHRGG